MSEPRAPRRVAFATLGCKVNHYETQAMRELFLAEGWAEVPFSASAEVYVVNTCTVTQTGDGKSRQLIARAHRANPTALIAVTGCYAETARDAVAALPGVGLVTGTTGRGKIVEQVNAALAQRAAADKPDACSLGSFMMQGEKPPFECLCAVRDDRTRATLMIQDGCVNYCSYCIIPYARGPLRSRPLDDIDRQLRLLAAEGYHEVVLTGIHLMSYGRDLADRVDLTDVLNLTKSIPGLVRVRLGSLEPGLVDEAFAACAAANPKICRQFHLSLQSGADTVLARMNRRYDTARFRQAAQALRAAMPGCALTTDVIAGFAGETAEEHRASLDFCREMAFARMHVFPFSLRRGTKAASMPGQLTKGEKEKRAGALIALGKTMTEAYLLAQVGTVQEVLVEQNGRGYTGSYVPVQTSSPPGALVMVHITDIQNGIAMGKELDNQ